MLTSSEDEESAQETLANIATRTPTAIKVVNFIFAT
jgi:hypothetical protein